MTALADVSARAHCYTCDKVKRLCLCERIARVDNRTPVHIVQHRNEHRHPFGTVRIARLGLSNMTLDVVRDENDPLSLPDDAAILFPDPGAPVLSEMPVEERPRRLIVVDGTWALASQLRRHHPALAGRAAVTLPPGPPSRYRLRSEPSPEAISTLEAIVRALEVLEPETRGLGGLIDAFDALNEDQLEVRKQHPPSPRHRAKRRPRKPAPPALTGDPAKLVLLYVELHQPRGQEDRFILRFTATRPSQGLLLDALVESPLPASRERYDNMRVPAAVGMDRLSLSELSARLRTLIQPSDTLVSWSVRPTEALRGLGLEQPLLSAKHHFGCQFLRNGDGKPGSLTDVVQRLGLTPPTPAAPGRGGQLLAALEVVVAAIRQRALDDTQA
ncbi:MAG: tRNA-uridine aminocarboxypropyltransferase [Sandaracinaceae bacterium]